MEEHEWKWLVNNERRVRRMIGRLAGSRAEDVWSEVVLHRYPRLVELYDSNIGPRDNYFMNLLHRYTIKYLAGISNNGTEQLPKDLAQDGEETVIDFLDDIAPDDRELIWKRVVLGESSREAALRLHSSATVEASRLRQAVARLRFRRSRTLLVGESYEYSRPWDKTTSVEKLLKLGVGGRVGRLTSCGLTWTDATNLIPPGYKIDWCPCLAEKNARELVRLNFQTYILCGGKVAKAFGCVGLTFHELTCKGSKVLRSYTVPKIAITVPHFNDEFWSSDLNTEVLKERLETFLDGRYSFP